MSNEQLPNEQENVTPEEGPSHGSGSMPPLNEEEDWEEEEEEAEWDDEEDEDDEDDL